MGAVLGTCAVCSGPGAVHTCMLCGRLVCPLHFRHGAGQCTLHPMPEGRDSGSPRQPPHVNR